MRDETAEIVRQWPAKARSDWATVEILLRNEPCPRDSACFHGRQFVEKLLKGLLTRHGIEAPRTHDIRRLIQMAESRTPRLSGFADAADSLTVHGVQSRYPGDWVEIDRSEMDEVVSLARELGTILQNELAARE